MDLLGLSEEMFTTLGKVIATHAPEHAIGFIEEAEAKITADLKVITDLKNTISHLIHFDEVTPTDQPVNPTEPAPEPTTEPVT